MNKNNLFTSQIQMENKNSLFKLCEVVNMIMYILVTFVIGDDLLMIFFFIRP